MKFQTLCAFALTASLPCATVLIANAQTTNSAPTSLAESAPKLPSLIEAKDFSVPASARRGLPRDAKTVFAVAAPLQGKPLLLHAWRVPKGELTLDVLARRVSKSTKRRGGTRLSATRRGRYKPGPRIYTRLNRIVLTRVPFYEEDPISVEVAPFRRGGVIWLSQSGWNSGSLFSTPANLLITLPDGLSGRAVPEIFVGEGSPGGGTAYVGRIAAGEFVLFQQDYSEGDSSYIPYHWNGQKYVAGERGPSAPDPD